MKFRNYCLVVMGNTKNILPEITKIAETSPNIMDAKGIIIATFQSVMEISELTEYFKLNKRNFIITDLHPESSGFNIMKEDINNALFGFLKDNDEERLQEKTDDLIQGLSSSTVSNKAVSSSKGKKKEAQISEKDVDKMTATEKNTLMNVLIEKGVSKTLSDNDLVLLKKLSI